MPVAKLTASGTPNLLKTEDGNDSLDTIIRQAIGKEPFLSFPRAGDSPVQWIQLLHALDQQGISNHFIYYLRFVFKGIWVISICMSLSFLG